MPRHRASEWQVPLGGQLQRRDRGLATHRRRRPAGRAGQRDPASGQGRQPAKA
jgi:hypothetical protein